MAMSDYLEEQLSSFLFRSNSTNFVTPDSLYLALYTSDPTDADIGDEVTTTGTGYERQLLSIGSDINGVSTNNIQVDFAEANISWGDVTHIGVRDELTAGNLLLHASLIKSLFVESGDTFSITIGNLRLTLK